MQEYNKRPYVRRAKRAIRKAGDPVHRAYMKAYRQQPEQLKRHCERNKERDQYNRSWVIAILGGECELCGCKNPLMLSLDHRLGDGATHRRKTGSNSRTVYRAVLKEGCPLKRYRILCMSCNTAVAHYGEKIVKQSIKERW